MADILGSLSGDLEEGEPQALRRRAGGTVRPPALTMHSLSFTAEELARALIYSVCLEVLQPVTTQEPQPESGFAFSQWDTVAAPDSIC